MKTYPCRSIARTLWLFLLSVVSVCAMAQHKITGVVLDKGSNEPVVGAAVMQAGTTNGTVTDIDGNFSLSVEQLPANISVSFLGFKTMEVKASSAKLGKLFIEVDSKTLEDVVVKSSIAVARKTPVALSSITPEIVEEKLGNKELPEILKSTPSVYATRAGGAFGDSEVRMRGFEQANIAVMVNGVPCNDMEWGGVYWSNWTGLTDVLRTAQTQRGLGASKISSPSVGGTIAYITKGLESKRGGSISYAVGNDGMNKITASVSSGMNDKGWAFTVLLGKNWGDGYIQGTDYVGYNWFLNVAKRINENHQLSFTATGAPQWHNQRNSGNGLKFAVWETMKDYMGDGNQYKYNPGFGYDKNGTPMSANYNKYHKPQFMLNHQWQINNKQSLSSAIYMSIGRGYGTSGRGRGDYSNSSWYGASKGDLNTTFRKADGTFDFGKIQDINENSTEGSLLAMSISKNYHTWVGLISNYDNKINDQFELSGGLDFRWYKGQHTNELANLFGGEYYIDDTSRDDVKPENNIAANDPEFINQKLHVGDVVYRDYDGYTVQGGIFAQLEYTLNNLNAYVSGSVSNTTYWRDDHFYYDESHSKSETVDFWGFTAKGGANYNINDYNNVFFNAGFISRAPFFSGGAFLSSTVSNATNPDAVNEKCVSFEVGYGFKNSVFSAKLNGYWTKWMDKTMAKTNDYSAIESEGISAGRWVLNLEGVDARHMGIELELEYNPARWVELTGMLSLGDWVWDCNTNGHFYNQEGQPLKDLKGHKASGIGAEDHGSMVVNLDKVKVGGSAQTTAALGVKFRPVEGLRIGMDWNLFANNYADWTISSNDITINSTYKYPTPWKLPTYYTFDANAGYSVKMGESVKATFSGNVDNLFDAVYIQTADDGTGHNWQTSYGFYGFGRTYSVKLKLDF